MTVAVERPNKHELRTRETRELLLSAAKTIFARDGYEAADLSEIAALAGRTKGAIYAHFKSKEDIFMALWEEQTLRRRAQMIEHLSKTTGVQENLEAMRQITLSMVEDKEWALLSLEFKLYAIRHPEARARLLRYLHEVNPPTQERRIAALLGDLPKGKEGVSRAAAVQVLATVLSGLSLETAFDATLLDAKTVREMTSRLFDALLPATGAELLRK
ncbi:TetR/AcrR family transcriptional regulator [Terriglobus tenax]|uniref:TetR/AcrR family transcriptional regulator n=1 Tax=Terriglobus tenax TaxID=1111115 RepID=UPI0021E0F9B7|nr:TetR/AcrR family transcriptional regulator [Terriglobus tenax]